METLSPSIDERMKKYPCDSCEASFTMSNNLRRHVRKSHRTPVRSNGSDVRQSDKVRRHSPVTPLRVAMIPWDLLHGNFNSLQQIFFSFQFSLPRFFWLDSFCLP